MNSTKEKQAVCSKDLCLLIVEDEEIVARMLVRTLKKYWRTISVARSSTEGLNMIAHNEYDVVLTDLDCPMEGEGIRIVQGAGLPVVVHTGNSSAVLPNGVCVLKKPVDTMVLIHTLMAEMAKWKSRHPSLTIHGPLSDAGAVMPDGVVRTIIETHVTDK
jgi:two-component system capsular synthesis sensor histidine kinase RcsC